MFNFFIIVMKQEFFKFQMSKEAMNSLCGGAATATFRCHCHTSGGTLAFDVSAESAEILDAKMTTECDGGGYSCVNVD